MQYLKLGFIRIPYEIKNNGGDKLFSIFGIRIPFSVYKDSMGKKHYKVFGMKVKIPFKDKLFVTRRQVNFQNRDSWSDREIRKMARSIFVEKQGYEPDFDNPKSMNEKIFWMKLNYHDPLVTRCCDKYSVKEYVLEKIGEDMTVPVIGAWDSADDIDFDVLPDKFVLKVNWSSGFNIIVKDKSKMDQNAVVDKIKFWMQPEQNSYYQAFNWGYKDMKPIVYAEKYVEQLDGQLFDYKIYCSQGKAIFLFISTDRYSGDGVTYDFFDMNFNHLDFTYGGKSHSKYKLEKPKSFDDMVKYAEILSEPFPFVRVDFYEVDGNPLVGEMTFYSGGGILKFEPAEWDVRLGTMINLD